MKKAIVLLITIQICCLGLYAQTKVTGVVFDSSGAPIADVTVIEKNIE